MMPPDRAWRIGQIAQGIVLGVLLVRAVLGLMALADNIVIFAYQGY